jgi:cytoskeletal protein CcmA (bactofilin family)
MSSNEIQLLNYSFLSESSTLRGEFDFSGDINIACFIQGKVTMLNNGTLNLEPNGTIHGDIHGDSMVIKGEVKGQIHSAGKVVLKSSAKVEGSIQAQNLIVHPGAILSLSIKTEED